MRQLPDVQDRGSRVIQINFTDEVKYPTTPVSATWTLTDGTEVVNDREDVPIIALAPVVYIPVYGDDVVYRDGSRRVLIVEYTYLSSLTGTVLPDSGMAEFDVVDVPTVR